jgi:hypothetical protein
VYRLRNWKSSRCPKGCRAIEKGKRERSRLW